jgi:hypothetical protein
MSTNSAVCFQELLQNSGEGFLLRTSSIEKGVKEEIPDQSEHFKSMSAENELANSKILCVENSDRQQEKTKSDAEWHAKISKLQALNEDLRDQLEA